MERRLSGRRKVTPVNVSEMDPMLKLVLEEHLCSVKECNDGTHTLIYPKGTTKREWFPRMLDEQYQICLPSGLEILEVMFFFMEKRRVFAVTD